MTQFLNLCLIDFTFRLSYYIARTPLLPAFALALGASEDKIGAIFAASIITGVILKFPAGLFSDIIGKRISLLLGLTVAAVSPFLYAFVTNIKSLLLLRYFHGIATAIYTPSSMAVVAGIAGKRKGELFSWLSAIKISTKAVATLIGTAAISTFVIYEKSLTGYHTTYLLCGIFGVLAFLLAFLFLKGIDKDAQSPAQRKYTTRA